MVVRNFVTVGVSSIYNTTVYKNNTYDSFNVARYIYDMRNTTFHKSDNLFCWDAKWSSSGRCTSQKGV